MPIAANPFEMMHVFGTSQGNIRAIHNLCAPTSQIDQIVRCQRLSQIADDMLGPQGPFRRLRPLPFVCGLHKPAALFGPGEIERSKMLADLIEG